MPPAIFHAFFRLSRHLPWRILIAAFLMLSAGTYLLLGWDFTFKIVSRDSEYKAKQYLSDYIKGNPDKEADLERFRREFGTFAVATKLYLDAEAVLRQWEVERLERFRSRTSTPPEVPMMQLASQTYLRDNEKALARFFEEYYPFLSAIDDASLRGQIIYDLYKISETPADWQVVTSNPAAFFAWRATINSPDVWDYYARNHDWLEEPLFAALGLLAFDLLAGYESEQPNMDLDMHTLRILRNARNIKQLMSALINENEIVGAFVLLALAQYGETIRLAVEAHGLPLMETVSVIHANTGFLNPEDGAPSLKQAIAQENSKKLADIYRENDSIWRYASEIPFALNLWNDAPQYANKILDKYNTNASFLFELYEHYDIRDAEDRSLSMPFVAEALVRHGDLAAFILHEYKDNRDFKEALRNPEIGARVIPFVIYEPHKIKDLKKDPRWVKKYVDDEGNHIQDDRWWEVLPGGSIAKIAVNMADGKPSTWEELGWATVDVAAIALAVFTGGQSATAATALKTASRTSLKIARIAGRMRTLEKTLQLPKIYSAGVRAGMLTKAAAASGKIYHISLKLLKDSGRVLLHSIQHQKWIWKCAAGALIAYKVYARRDLLYKAPEQLGELLGRVLKGSLESVPRFLTAAAKEFIPASSNNVLSILTHVIICVLVFLAGLFLLRQKRQKRRLV